MPNFKKSKGFQLKSGNTTPFKSMGASPIKKTGIWQVGEEGIPVRITEEEAQIAESQGAGTAATAGDKESIPADRLYPGKIIRDLSHGEEAVRDLYARGMEMQGGEDITQEQVDAKVLEQQRGM